MPKEVLVNSEKLIIRPYIESDLKIFVDMFYRYFNEDFKIEMDKNKAEKICKMIGQNSLDGITPLDMFFVDDKVAGFICYQVDSENSDWCERPGWGFIREIYIRKNMRGQGYAKKIISHTEDKIRSMGAKNIYLTSDESEAFWIARGYKKTGAISSINHDPIYEKK